MWDLFLNKRDIRWNGGSSGCFQADLAERLYIEFFESLYTDSQNKTLLSSERNDNTVEWVLSFKLWCLNFYKLMSTQRLQYLSSCMVSNRLQVQYLLTNCNICHHVWCLIVYKLISTHWPQYLSSCMSPELLSKRSMRNRVSSHLWMGGFLCLLLNSGRILITISRHNFPPTLEE